jgi:pyruvate dehydrogenase E1 component
MPSGAREGILKGMYRFRASEKKNARLHAQLFGSGAILREVMQAQKMLEGKYDIAADVWSITSYKELCRDGHAAERWNLLHPTEQPRIPYVTACLSQEPGVFVAASDYVKALPDSISRWFPRPLHSLGTDGFGRSDTRKALRDFFEVDARFVTLATLAALARAKRIGSEVVQKAMIDMEIDAAKSDPLTS